MPSPLLRGALQILLCKHRPFNANASTRLQIFVTLENKLILLVKYEFLSLIGEKSNV